MQNLVKMPAELESKLQELENLQEKIKSKAQFWFVVEKYRIKLGEIRSKVEKVLTVQNRLDLIKGQLDIKITNLALH